MSSRHVRWHRHLESRLAAASIALQASQPIVWRQLYDLLVRPVRAHLPRTPGALVTIVPHGPLGALAFAALQNERGRYLLEDYTPHYVPAGAVLQFTAAKRHADSRRSGGVLLIADPALPPARSRLEPQLARLPGARKEIRAIAPFVPRARLTMIQDAAATETRIRAAASGKTVLHFATHAIVRDDEPLRSYLALAAEENREGSADGVLSAEEIYALDLDADLVVLSACRSAGGRVTGDGIATFARAFIYAGAPSLVASLWDVADEPTNRLLPDFYRAWMGGASKARALRAAQLRLLHDLRANLVRVDTAGRRRLDTGTSGLLGRLRPDRRTTVANQLPGIRTDVQPRWHRPRQSQSSGFRRAPTRPAESLPRIHLLVP